MFLAPDPTQVVHELAELPHHFELGAKPLTELGIEHEKIAVLPNGTAPSYEAVIGPLLEELAAPAWERVLEAGSVVALKRGRTSVTLEPGGQLELSDAPRSSASAVALGLKEHLAELEPWATRHDISFLAIGFRPFGTIDEVPWMPKGRYRVMRDYLPTRGGHGLEMMKRTATVQVNLDYADEADCAEKIQVAMGITSLVTALWSSSPIVDGKLTDYQSYRAAMWLDTDEDRCGILPFVFAADARERLFENYTDWALDVPMFFVHRDGAYLPAHGMTFRRYLDQGFAGRPATLGDWEVHLSTLFPEVRLKRYLEIRGADSGPLPMVRALPALYRGLLYDAEARRAAWELVAGWTLDERQALRHAVPRAGLRAVVRGAPILECCRRLVQIAKSGLVRLGDDDLTLLGPVEEIAASGRTVADGIAETYRAVGGDRKKLIAALTL